MFAFPRAYIPCEVFRVYACCDAEAMIDPVESEEYMDGGGLEVLSWEVKSPGEDGGSHPRGSVNVCVCCAAVADFSKSFARFRLRCVAIDFFVEDVFVTAFDVFLCVFVFVFFFAFAFVVLFAFSFKDFRVSVVFVDDVMFFFFFAVVVFRGLDDIAFFTFDVLPFVDFFFAFVEIVDITGGEAEDDDDMTTDGFP